MARSGIPSLTKESKIIIICEGQEDFAYLSKIKSLGVFNTDIDLSFKDAEGNSKIYDNYMNLIRTSDADLVLIFCDTGAESNTQSHHEFTRLLTKISHLYPTHGVVSDIVYFANPVTMQIFINHFKKIDINSESKKDYEDIVKECTGVIGYDASKYKLKQFMSLINRDNYYIMKENLKDKSYDYHFAHSTNILKLFNNLELDETSWINKIKKRLDIG